MPEFIHINNLSFAYDNTIEPLFESLSFQLQSGWTGVVGANGSGKTTLLKLLTGQLEPDGSDLILLKSTYYCEQRTDDMPSGLIPFLESTDKRAFRIQSELEIKRNWTTKWPVLSHGERKRCQIGTALFQNSSLLAVDEPSNHLDHSSKQTLFRALKNYKGIGLLVSHDRELLDNLCSHTLFLDPPHIDLRSCSYSVAIGERAREHLETSRLSKMARQQVKKLKRQVHIQHQKAQQSDRRVSKSKVSRKDHDTKSKIDQARLSGKDATAGRIKKRLQNQLEKSITHKDTIKIKKETVLGISFSENESKRHFPLIISSGDITLGPGKFLSFPELSVQYGNKIGICGNNGSGKSTFINYFLKRITIPATDIIYIPQEISLGDSKKLIDRIHDYDNETKGKIMTLISRLGSDPKHMIETNLPSPGEVRKLLLAEGIMLNPGIIIMDEPTNHMDLPSVQCVESALKECPCAQLLISHDPVFLKNTVFEYWNFCAVSKNEFKISVDR